MWVFIVCFFAANKGIVAVMENGMKRKIGTTKEKGN